MGCKEAYDLIIHYIEIKEREAQRLFNEEDPYLADERRGALNAISGFKADFISDRRGFLAQCIKMSGGSNV
jgi:hypothetical protein